jgi:hypothetical protein
LNGAALSGHQKDTDIIFEYALVGDSSGRDLASTMYGNERGCGTHTIVFSMVKEYNIQGIFFYLKKNTGIYRSSFSFLLYGNHD